MHPDLSKHLHTPECNLLAEQLSKCHKDHNIKKFFGFCNEIDMDLTKCLRKEVHVL